MKFVYLTLTTGYNVGVVPDKVVAVFSNDERPEEATVLLAGQQQIIVMGHSDEVMTLLSTYS